MVISSGFALFVTGVEPLRKFVILLLVPAAADDTGHTPWVKSWEVTHMGLHVREPSGRFNSTISQLCCDSFPQVLGDGATRADRKHKCLPNLVLCFDFLGAGGGGIQKG